MTIQNNKSGGSEVTPDQTEKPEVGTTGPITENDIIGDILSDDSEVETVTESTDEKPETEDGKSKTEETPATDKPDEGETPAGDEPEDKTKSKTPAEGESPEEPFATLGGQKFKTKEDLLTFANSNVGYNTWLTGQIKKLHPDWFNDDGSIKTKELDAAITKSKTKVEDAAETIKELADVDPEELTDEQKEEIKKARAILAPLGVVFRDDPMFKKIEETNQAVQSTEMEKAADIVKTFQGNHPLAVEHAIPFADFLDDHDYGSDIEKAWRVYKAENEIEEEIIKKPEDNTPRKPMDSVVPAKVPKEGGHTPPKQSTPDIMDEIIGSSTGF